MKADYLGYALLDTIVDNYFIILEKIGEDIENMEEELVTSKGYQLPLDILVFLGGIFVIYKIVTHKGFMRRWESFIED